MSITKGAMTVRRYRVIDSASFTGVEGWRETLEEKLDDNRFRTPAGSSVEISEGWARTDGEPVFDLRDDYLFNQFVLVAFRRDQKVIPGSTYKREVNSRVQVWCKENGRSKAPASVRADIREAVRSEMASRALSKMSLTEIVWDTQNGFVLVANTGNQVNDSVRKLFRRTFGLELEPVVPNAGHFFKKWLWWQMEAEGGNVDAGDLGAVEAYVADRVVFHGDFEKVTLAGESVGTSSQARVALRAGHVIHELRCSVRIVDSDDPLDYTFSLRGPELDLVQCRLPSHVKTGSDDILYERMYLYGKLADHLDALLAKQAAECSGDLFGGRTLPAMVKWVLQELDLSDEGHRLNEGEIVVLDDEPEPKPKKVTRKPRLTAQETA